MDAFKDLVGGKVVRERGEEEEEEWICKTGEWEVLCEGRKVLLGKDVVLEGGACMCLCMFRCCLWSCCEYGWEVSVDRKREGEGSLWLGVC